MTARSIMVASRTKVVFSLSGQNVITADAVPPYDTTSAIKIDTDGNVYRGNAKNGAAIGYTQIDTLTDWLRPIRNPTQYFAQYSNVTGSFSATPGAVDTPIAITTDLVWTINSTIEESRLVDFDLEILDTDMVSVLAPAIAYRIEILNTV